MGTLAKFGTIDAYVHRRMSKLASVKYGPRGVTGPTASTTGGSRTSGSTGSPERSGTGLRMPAMNGVGKPCAGEPHARFDRGPLGKLNDLRGLLVPGRCAERCHHDGLVGTSTAAEDCRTSGLPHRIAPCDLTS